MHGMISRAGGLESLLNEYLGSTTYYYVVVGWIDRVLFAPAELRRVYREELDNRLSDSSIA